MSQHQFLYNIQIIDLSNLLANPSEVLLESVDILKINIFSFFIILFFHFVEKFPYIGLPVLKNYVFY